MSNSIEGERVLLEEAHRAPDMYLEIAGGYGTGLVLESRFKN